MPVLHGTYLVIDGGGKIFPPVVAAGASLRHANGEMKPEWGTANIADDRFYFHGIITNPAELVDKAIVFRGGRRKVVGAFPGVDLVAEAVEDRYFIGDGAGILIPEHQKKSIGEAGSQLHAVDRFE